MKKRLGINLFDGNVPSKSDAVILFAASAACRRRRMVRRIEKAVLGIAAISICAAAVLFTVSREKAQEQQLYSGYSEAELLAMSDFTAFEQASYAMDQFALVFDDSENNYRI